MAYVNVDDWTTAVARSKGGWGVLGIDVLCSDLMGVCTRTNSDDHIGDNGHRDDAEESMIDVFTDEIDTAGSPDDESGFVAVVRFEGFNQRIPANTLIGYSVRGVNLEKA